MNAEDSRTKARIAKLLALLGAGDKHQWELSDLAPLARRHTREYVDHLVENELAHIVDWVRIGTVGAPIRVLRFGPGTNIPKPAALSDTDRKRAWRAKLKQDSERYDSQLAKERNRRRVPYSDPLVNALFGR